jgi:hypothetical protein
MIQAPCETNNKSNSPALHAEPLLLLLVYAPLPGSSRYGVRQLGKKALATIFDVCPLVALLLGRK